MGRKKGKMDCVNMFRCRRAFSSVSHRFTCSVDIVSMRAQGYSLFLHRIVWECDKFFLPIVSNKTSLIA